MFGLEQKSDACKTTWGRSGKQSKKNKLNADPSYRVKFVRE